MMEKETKKVAKYNQPEAEVIIIRMESLVCKSVPPGGQEDTDDEEVPP